MNTTISPRLGSRPVHSMRVQCEKRHFRLYIPHLNAASIGLVVASNDCSRNKNLVDALQSGCLEQCRFLYSNVITNSTNNKPKADLICLRFLNNFAQELLRDIHTSLTVQSGFSWGVFRECSRLKTEICQPPKATSDEARLFFRCCLWRHFLRGRTLANATQQCRKFVGFRPNPRHYRVVDDLACWNTGRHF